MSKHSNISIFVTHLGCPQQCSFCNQRYIACSEAQPQKEDIINAIKTAVNSKNYNPLDTELAFFGGSFTAIDKEYMLSLLEAAYPFYKNGDICGIRISTRPDAINDEILSILKRYGVTAIELGAQSMDDEVLTLNRRGHTVKDIIEASQLIKEYGFELGLQMMTGLLGSTEEKDILTASGIIKLSPNTVRIYPTIVFEDTYLGELFKAGEYKPQTLDNAIELTAKLLKMFMEENIAVIRTGLHTINEEKYLGGPWHPAFRELCDANIYLENAKNALKDKGDYIIYVSRGSVSKMSGQKRKNIEILRELGFNCKVAEDDTLGPFQIKTERVGVCE